MYMLASNGCTYIVVFPIRAIIYIHLVQSCLNTMPDPCAIYILQHTRACCFSLVVSSIEVGHVYMILHHKVGCL